MGEINEKEVQFGVDMVRSRANVMRQPGYEWNVSSALDDIEPSVDGVVVRGSRGKHNAHVRSDAILPVHSQGVVL